MKLADQPWQRREVMAVIEKTESESSSWEEIHGRLSPALGSLPDGFLYRELIELLAEHWGVSAEVISNRHPPGEPYATYLRSPHWLALREWALKAAENRCMICNGAERLQVHHRTYERLGAERPADLVVLCDRCHDLFHEHRRLVRRIPCYVSTHPR